MQISKINFTPIGVIQRIDQKGRFTQTSPISYDSFSFSGEKTKISF